MRPIGSIRGGSIWATIRAIEFDARAVIFGVSELVFFGKAIRSMRYPCTINRFYPSPVKK